MCNKEKISVEHAPPKSFFPSGMRNNLITVDSCQEHNEDTSLDDEYVKNLITMLIGGNPTAYKQFSEKTLKSFKRSPALLQSTTEKQHPVNFPSFPSSRWECIRRPAYKNDIIVL
jgi:hypothetical protein